MNSAELLAYDVWGQRLEENWEGPNAGETYQTEGVIPPLITGVKSREFKPRLVS